MNTATTPATKEAVDTALECLKEGTAICWDCIQLHYPEQFAKRNGMYAYRRRCDACGTKTDCTWSGCWRTLIYPSKPTTSLIEIFESDNSHLCYRTICHDSCSALVKKGKEGLKIVLEYLEKKQTNPINEQGWSNFFYWYALSHKVIPHDPNMPKNYSEWLTLFKSLN